MRKTTALLAALLPAAAASAQTACWIPYAAFEEKVPQHIDLERCPGDRPAPDRGFCRATLEGGDIVIHVFEHNDPAGGACLVRVHRQDFNSFAALFGVTVQRP
jgi:hypothetical protein